MENPTHRFECEVVFSDTDASGWVHFSRILGYVEKAEHDFLNAVGFSVYDREKGGWPRVRVSCDYKRPLMFQDEILVALSLRRIGKSSLTWDFELLKSDGELAASGEMVSVKVDGKGAPLLITADERLILEGKR